MGPTPKTKRKPEEVIDPKQLEKQVGDAFDKAVATLSGLDKASREELERQKKITIAIVTKTTIPEELLEPKSDAPDSLGPRKRELDIDVELAAELGEEVPEEKPAGPAGVRVSTTTIVMGDRGAANIFARTLKEGLKGINNIKVSVDPAGTITIENTSKVTTIDMR